MPLIRTVFIVLPRAAVYLKWREEQWKDAGIGGGCAQPVWLREVRDHDGPIIICHSDDPARWMRAEIKISSIAFYCGGLQS